MPPPDAAPLTTTTPSADRAALHASEMRYRRLFETAQDGILLLNAQSGQIEDVNPFLIKMLGYSHAEFLGKKLWEVGAFIDTVQCKSMFELLQTTGYVRYDDMPLKTRQGRLIDVEFVSNAYDCAGTRVIQCNVRDISLHKAAEMHLRTQELAKQAAEAANAAKSAFLSNMSHEIRTPLGAITGLAYLIRRSHVTAQQADWLTKIDAAGKHLLTLIDAILDMSKIDAGKVTLEAVNVNVPGIVATVAALLGDQAHAKHLALLVQRSSVPAELVGDPGRLQQALLNIAANAVKFTEHGSVTLRALCDPGDQDDAGSLLVRFEVQDTGIGISPQVLPRLFSPFEQADNSTTRLYGGTGLGLAIVKQLAQLMGGAVGARSTPGEGSTFWFTARLRKRGPLSQVPAAVVSAAQAQLARAHAACRILVVDDDPLNRQITQALLADTFAQVDVAAGGQEALRLAEAQTYDLVLMDLQMPGLGGPETTRCLRLLPGYGCTPIIALTASAFAQHKADCLAAGMDDFVTKPFDPEALFATLLSWLSRSAPRTA